MAETFVFKRVDSQEQLREIFRLRFQVYAKECRFIREEDYPQGVETDAFDAHAVHFGAFDTSGQVIGAVRLILPSCGKFPIEDHCPTLDIDRNIVRHELCAEISRLTISKLYRRRANDGLYYEAQAQDQRVEAKSGDGEYFIRRVRPMAFGLYRAMYQECKRLGIRYWFAMMEKTLWTLLKIHGFVFRPIGSEVDFYGMVTPYVVDIGDLEENVHAKFPQFYEYFMENLKAELQPTFSQ